MSLPDDIANAARRLGRLGHDLDLRFSCRTEVIDLMKLALVCREHVLLLGPPGSGKSELVMQFAHGVQAASFQYLLTRFTEPAELFGPLDLKAFHEGRFHIITERMLPQAEIAFLDEVFQASSAILNTLLTVIHERSFHNGATNETVPLISLFGASNALPDDANLLAFSDRFVLRCDLAPIPDESLDDLLAKGWSLEVERIRGDADMGQRWVTPDQLKRLHAQLPAIGIDAVETSYGEIIRRLRAQGVVFSERRLIKGLKLIRAAALLDGREQADGRDFWPLLHIWNGLDDIPTLREVVQPFIEDAGGPVRTRRRRVETIIDAFELLRSRSPDSESAWVAHLGALAQLRRELLLHHPDRQDLIDRVESEIRAQLETSAGAAGAADERR